MIDSQEFVVKGMQRDLSVSKFNPEFAFENMNIRITAREDNTLLSITNEKGNKACKAALKPNMITRVMRVVNEGGKRKYGIRFKSEYPLDGPITLKSFPTPGYTEQGSILPDREIVLTNDIVNTPTIVWSVDVLAQIMLKSFDVISQSPKETICYFSDTRYEQSIPEFDDIALTVQGECIGKEVINDYLVLFTVSEDDPDGKNSRIYRLDYDGSNFISNLLYHGNLGFDKSHPIESIGVFENETLQKVYWTDGLNQPRFINIVASDEKRKEWNDGSFNFISSLGLDEKIKITKVASSGGVFPSGVTQYAFTYYNKYGQQSNIFHISPLNYNTFDKRGASPEENVGIGYEISIQNADTRFDYIRVYSIIRTSIDGTPIVKRIADLATTKSTILYIDSNSTGDTVDPTELLYIGGEEAVFGCICQKDNTLFLGDIKLTRKLIPSEIKNKFKTLPILIGNKETHRITSIKNSYYDYKFQLNKDSYEITSFKYLDYYRLGVQFQHISGRWSEVIPIKDVRISNYPKLTSSTVYVPYLFHDYTITDEKGNANPLNEYLKEIVKSGYIRARGVVVYPSISERAVLCQGFVSPTVYNVGDRASNSPFSQSSWYTRPIQNSEDSGAKYLIQNRPHTALKAANQKGSEIQSMILDAAIPDPFVENSSEKQSTFVGNYGDMFYVDSNICTLHSPDIEFDESLSSIDLSNYDFRIVGYTRIYALNWDADITLASAPYNSAVGGFIKLKIPGDGVSYSTKLNPLTSYALYFDAHDRTDGLDPNGDRDGGSAAYPVYTWQRDGSLANAKDNRYGKLDKKKFSQLLYCRDTVYGDPYPEDGLNMKYTSDIQIFNSNEVSPLILNAPEDTELGTVSYYGNVDKLLSISRSDDRKLGYLLTVSNWTNRTSDGYINVLEAVKKDFKTISSLGSTFNDKAILRANDPIRIRYKSSPHGVFMLTYYNDGSTQRVLPVATSNLEWEWNLVGRTPFWNESKLSRIHGPKTTFNASNYPSLWIGEFYKKVDTATIFGGQSEEAYTNNKWTPAGPPVKIVDGNGELKDFIIEFKQGDTFYQRYDHLKTYPFTLEDQNSVVEIVSTMLESRVNIDGRYDKNRGYPGLVLTPTNFNLSNKVYSQKDNFFQQQYINPNNPEVDNFISSLTWTKTKSLSEDIDTWTNITLASTLDLDGDKGRLRAMKLFNNEIIAFQDNAISNILFNSRVQMNASDGIPIEIANSGKVDGKRYISNHIGTVNKFGIIETPLGLYFMDNNSTSIYQYNGQLNDISDGLGFRAWCSDHIKPDEFGKPLDQIFTGHYDRSNSDLYFNNPQYSLGFSSLLNQFTSFYSYQNIPFMFNVRDKFFSLRLQGGNTEVWEQNAGDYNYYYGEFQPFYTHIIANKDMTKDKVFNTLEFRADSYMDDTLLNYDTFDRLDVWNEYQRGSLVLSDRINHPSSLKKKFRVWKANFPREAGKPLNRIRNTWVNVKLGKYTPNKLRTVLHDMTVHYTV